MKRRTVDWMNRRGKRKFAKYCAAFGFSPEKAERNWNVPARFVRAHIRWQKKGLVNQLAREPSLLARRSRWGRA